MKKILLFINYINFNINKGFTKLRTKKNPKEILFLEFGNFLFGIITDKFDSRTKINNN